MNTFQTITIMIFIAMAVLAVLIFAGILPGLEGNTGPKSFKVSIWGTFDKDLMEKFLQALQETNKNYVFDYTQKQPQNFEEELVNAMANNEGPDLFFLSEDLILKHRKKIKPILFKDFAPRDFKETFVDEGELFLDEQNKNIIALPFSIDPLVMYYNKDLLKNAFLTNPPKDWEEFLEQSIKLTIKDEDNEIKQSGTAMGEYSNIPYAKEILSALFLQTGNSIVDKNKLKSVLSDFNSKNSLSAESALRFYTDFSNPRKSSYSWNMFLEPSFTRFLKGKLAVYFGFASEYNKIKEKNPNINFDVALSPQPKDSGVKSTFGRMQGVAISNKNNKYENMVFAAKFLTSYESENLFSKTFSIPAGRKDILSQKNDTPRLSVFNESAIISRSWLDPDTEKTSAVFKNMINTVKKGEKNLSQAINTASSGIQSALNTIKN